MVIVSSRYTPAMIRPSNKGKSLSVDPIAKINGLRRIAALPSSWLTKGFGLTDVTRKGIFNEIVSDVYLLEG